MEIPPSPAFIIPTIIITYGSSSPFLINSQPGRERHWKEAWIISPYY